MLVVIPIFNQIGTSQLMKSFSNEGEWKLSWLVWEYGLETKQYQACCNAMDSILLITDQPDFLILSVGIDCYLQTKQKEKAVQQIQKLVDFGYLEICDKSFEGKLSEEELQRICGNSKILEQTVSHPGLRHELVNMLIADQYLRGFGIINQLAKDGYEVYSEYLANHNQHELDSVNRILLKEIFKEFGFPTKKMVGKWGLISIQLIIQHADDDIEFQKKYVAEILKLVKNGEIEGQAYAYLIDRIKTNENEHQIYGTQYIQNYETGEVELKPTIKLEEVNKRRMEMGMMPIEKYLEN